MTLPLVALEALGKAKQAGDFPVIGHKTTTVKTTKKGTVVTTEESLQLRGWEIGAIGGVVILGAWLFANELEIGGKDKDVFRFQRISPIGAAVPGWGILEGLGLV